jgi:hypothetical protein
MPKKAKKTAGASKQARGIAGEIVRYARSSARAVTKAAKAVGSRKKARKG